MNCWPRRLLVLMGTVGLAGCVTQTPYVVKREEYREAMRRLQAGEAPAPLIGRTPATTRPHVVPLKASHAYPAETWPKSDAGEDEIVVIAVDLAPPHLAAGWSLVAAAGGFTLGSVTNFTKEGGSADTGIGLACTALTVAAFAAWQLAEGYDDDRSPFDEAP